MGVARAVGFGKLTYLNARPVVWPFNEGARRIKTQERQRQPDAVENLQGIMQRLRTFRFYHFRLRARSRRQGIATIRQVEIQTQQGTVGRFTHEATMMRGFLRRQPEIEKLHAAVCDERDALFVITQIHQHKIRPLSS